jgi:hypothetical protein
LVSRSCGCVGWSRAALAAFLAAGLLDGGLALPRAEAREVLQFGDSGFLRIDYQVQARAGERDQGPLAAAKDTYDFYLRRNRLSFIGAANETFGAVVQLELNGGRRLGDTSVAEKDGGYDFLLLDAFATADLFEFLKVRAGKTKHVLTREVQEGCYDPLSIDRSPFMLGPFSLHADEKSTRDVGLVLWGNAFDKTLQYRVAAMQGNRFGSTPDGIGLRYTGRVHLTFLDKEAGAVYRGTYLGKKRVLTVGAGYEMQPNAVLSSALTGGAEDYKAFTLDAFFEHPTAFGTFTLSGAYLRTWFGEAGLRDVADAQGASGERNGWYWKAGYMVWHLQPFGRIERWSFAKLGDVPNQELRWWVGGINYYVKGQDVRLTAEYAWTDFQRGDARDFHTVLVQLQAQL